jgi:4-hydroxybenzoate polyprenyltransferase
MTVPDSSLKLVSQTKVKISKIIGDLENSKAPFWYFILAFYAAVTLRNFIETISTKVDIYPLGLAHWYISYSALALTFIVFLYLVSKTPVEKIAKTILPGFLFLITAPIIDLIVSRGQGISMNYLLPFSLRDLLQRFFTYFGNYQDFAITPGIRVEFAIGLLAAFIYLYIKNSDFLKSLWQTFLFYATIFVFLILPFIIKEAALLLGLMFNYTDLLFIDFYALLILIMGGLIFYFWDKKYFLRLLGDMRYLRQASFIMMLFLGVAVGLASSQNGFSLTLNNLFDFIFAPLSLFFAFGFSIITNNIADFRIDKISNPERPLVSGDIKPETYQKFAWLFLAGAMFYSLLVSAAAFFLILLFMASYFIYSMPPFRFKRVPVLSKLAISFNYLVSLIIGYLVINPRLDSFPSYLWPIFLLGITGALNMIDLKDFSGDKAEGIATLPVLLGLKWAKMIISLLVFIAYATMYFLFGALGIPLFWFFVFLALGAMQAALINRKEYTETPMLWLGACSLGLLIFLAWLY